MENPIKLTVPSTELPMVGGGDVSEVTLQGGVSQETTQEGHEGDTGVAASAVSTELQTEGSEVSEATLQENVSRGTPEAHLSDVELLAEADAMAGKNERFIELATQSTGEPRVRSRTSIVGTMLLAASMGMGLAHTEDASAREQGNILQVFGDQVTKGVTQQIYEAGKDSGGVMGGAARIMIDRTVNAATHKVLEGAGVPSVRAPEQVVVVPRSVESGPGVYSQQRQPSYGEVRYGGGAVMRGGYEGGYDTQMRNIEAQYATNKSRLMIESNYNPEQLQAVKEEQKLNLMRLNKSFNDRLLIAQPDEKLILMQEWTAAKAKLVANQRMQSPEGKLAELEKRRALDVAALQIQSQR